jgi:hypothetical protein
MASVYMYKVKHNATGAVETRSRRLRIPNSPTEALRGETYSQQVLDDLHASEQQNIRDYCSLHEDMRDYTLVDEPYLHDVGEVNDEPSEGLKRRSQQWLDAETKFAEDSKTPEEPHTTRPRRRK